MAAAAFRGNLPDALRRLSFPISVVDSEGRVAWQNDAMRRMVGDRVGRPFGEPIVREDRQRFREQYLNTLTRGEPRDLSVRFRALDGRIHNAEVSSVPLVEDDRVVGIFGVFHPEADDSYAPPPQVQLTPRQQQVLVELARGCSTHEIAQKLGIATETVRNHIREILRRLDAHSRLEAVVRAHELDVL
jgi:PAS domain S-box-containing protein